MVEDEMLYITLTNRWNDSNKTVDEIADASFHNSDCRYKHHLTTIAIWRSNMKYFEKHGTWVGFNE